MGPRSAQLLERGAGGGELPRPRGSGLHPALLSERELSGIPKARRASPEGGEAPSLGSRRSGWRLIAPHSKGVAGCVHAARTLRAPHLHLRDPPRPAPHRPRRALRTRDTACQAGTARGLGRLRLTDLSRLRRRTRGASRPWHLPRPPPRCVPSTAFLQRVASSFGPLD